MVMVIDRALQNTIQQGPLKNTASSELTAFPSSTRSFVHSMKGVVLLLVYDDCDDGDSHCSGHIFRVPKKLSCPVFVGNI